MSASSGRRRIVQRVVEELDPRVVPDFLRTYSLTPAVPLELPAHGSIVLVGHRAAGKSRVLPLISAIYGWPEVDLDREIERRSGRQLVRWVVDDPAAFRQAEREAFGALPPHRVVAAGGGFLALHADLLAGHLPVLIPVSFETYRERLIADTTRPRLRPELSAEQELAAVFREREALHARAPVMELAVFLRRTLGE